MKGKHHKSLLYYCFPFLEWLKGYNLSYLRGDAFAGLTVAVVLVPQAMAYAMLAGMPPVYGLYAATVTPPIAALWGSLRQLATGPIAITSLLVLTTLSPMAEPGSERFIEMALLLALIIGIIYLVIGVFGLGLIMSFISHSAIRGFTAAASLIIISTQLPHLLGIQVTQHDYILHMLLSIIKGLPGIHILTFFLGLASLVIIFLSRRYNKRLPAGLITILTTTFVVWIFKLDQNGVVIVGHNPAGLPGIHLPYLDFDTASSLIGPAFVIALVSFAETYSVGKAVSAETKQKIDVDQEFIGQGMANIIGSFFNCYPVSGSFSRTAINFSSGGKTGISNVISSIFVLISLFFLTPALSFIPRAALAALVIGAVIILFHPKEVFKLWRMNRHDGIVAICVFVLALLVKPDYALLFGIILSLMFFLWKTMHPRIVRVSKDPGLNMFVNADIHNLPSCPQILQLRSDNSIYFANAEYTVEHLLERLYENNTPVKFLLLDFQSMAFIDITGIDELRTLMEEIRQNGVQLAIIGARLPVEKVFKDSGFINELGEDKLMRNRGDAISRLFNQIDHEYCITGCPHYLFLECSTIK